MTENEPMSEEELRHYEQLFGSDRGESGRLIPGLIAEVRRARVGPGALTWDEVDRLRDTVDKLREGGHSWAVDLKGLEDTADSIADLLPPRPEPG